MENISEASPVANKPSSVSSDLENGIHSALALGLVSCGAIGTLLFTAIYLIAGATRPGYDAMAQPVSALSLGPGGWAQQANFILYGALLIVAAVGWYRILGARLAVIWFPLLQSVAGLCLIGAGFSSMDPWPGYPPGVTPGPTTTHGALHSLFAWILIVSLAIGCFALAPYFWRTRGWRGWAIYSGITGALILVFWGMFVQGAGGPVAGLSERLSAGSHGLWLCALTAALLLHHWRSRQQATLPS